MEIRFVGGPFDGQTKEAQSNLVAFFDGMTLTFNIDSVGHQYVWKEGMTFEYQGFHSWERPKPEPDSA